MVGEVSAKKDTIQTEHQQIVVPQESLPYAKNEYGITKSMVKTQEHHIY